ncbi:MAG: hypothetical protein KBS95_06645 [Alistipes sp.]|nr:hypothetical protein [Candidatus Alistipes equi]
MKLRTIIILAIAILSSSVVFAQGAITPRKVNNVTLEALTGEKVQLPEWGKKNLMIFYVDPDKPKQNQEFTEEMEQNKRASGANILGFGIMNLKDAPFVPNSLACKLANKRTEKNHATVLADKDRILATAWNLGDCNNKFVLLVVTKEGELVYIHKGEHSEAEKEEFYKFIEKYR